jgi:hypothetical protein
MRAATAKHTSSTPNTTMVGRLVQHTQATLSPSWLWFFPLKCDATSENGRSSFGAFVHGNNHDWEWQL